MLSARETAAMTPARPTGPDIAALQIALEQRVDQLAWKRKVFGKVAETCDDLWWNYCHVTFGRRTKQ